MTTRHPIVAKNREHPIRIASSEDFTLGAGREIEPEAALADPTLSLYCFDFERKTALFVKTPDSVDLTKAPFLYQAQSEHATAVVEMPMSVLRKLAEDIPLPPKGLILIHSVGRCGSTLISKALESAPSVHSLSEPDTFTQLVNLRDWDHSIDNRVRDLARVAVRWHCKPRVGAPADFVAVKTRSQVMEIADLIADSFPAAKTIFLYRDGASWLRAIYRIVPVDRSFEDVDQNREMEERFEKMISILQPYRIPDHPMHPMRIWALNWMSGMENYLRLAARGIPLCAMRFEEIVADPYWATGALFDFCGIPDVDPEVLKETFAADSQKGTIFDRETLREAQRVLSEEVVEDCLAFMRSRQTLESPHVILPGTLMPSG